MAKNDGFRCEKCGNNALRVVGSDLVEVTLWREESGWHDYGWDSLGSWVAHEAECSECGHPVSIDELKALGIMAYPYPQYFEG